MLILFSHRIRPFMKEDMFKVKCIKNLLKIFQGYINPIFKKCELDLGLNRLDIFNKKLKNVTSLILIM